MELTTRQLAFLEHEMTQIIESEDRSGEDQLNASAILGKVEGQIEIEKERNKKTTEQSHAVHGS